MNDEMERRVDALLRAHFEGPVPDDGFCDRVMDRLPVQRQRKRWPLVAGTLAGIVTCGLSLWSAPITQAGWRDWLSGDLSAPAIALFVAMTGMAALALLWSIAEADDRIGLASTADRTRRPA